MASLDVQGRGKLGPKFYMPFEIEERISKLVYKLKLTVGAKIHNIFHVGLLKRFTEAPPSQPATLPPTQHGRVCLEPEEASKCRVARGHHELLIKWKRQPAAAPSWMDLEEFWHLYPHFQLTDELILQGRRDVMLGIPYQCRTRPQPKAGEQPTLDPASKD
jgi:hypothetical protein